MHVFETDRLWQVTHGQVRWQCLARHRGQVLGWYIHLHGLPHDLASVSIELA